MLSFLVRRFLKNPPAATLEPVKATKRKLHSSAIYKPLVWIDCEMTGLDISKDHIIEICCIITDGHLNVIDETGYESTVHVPKKVLDNMNEWCVQHHGESGLTAKVLANPQQTLAKVQRELLEYIQSHIPEPRTSLMAGNSIHMDKFFMMKEFPEVIEHLHYRLVDVSSIMEVGFRHNPALMKMFPKKKGAHTARSDIMESIEQLRWYRNNYLHGDIPEHLRTDVPSVVSESCNDPEYPNKKAKVAASEENETEEVAADDVVVKETSSCVELADGTTLEVKNSSINDIPAEVKESSGVNDVEVGASSENSEVEIVEVSEEEVVDKANETSTLKQ